MILTFFVVGTTQRNILWQDTLQLYEDTVAKTPDFAPVRNELALALLKHNRKREANDQLEQSQALAAKQGVRSVFINKASLAVSEGRCEEARELLRKVVKERKKVSTSLLKDLIKVNEAMLLSPMPEKEKKSIREDLLQFYVRLYSRNHDPFIRYRAGIVAMFLGRNQEAAVFFREAYRRAPEGAHYRAAAAKLAEKCNRGTPIAHERVCQ